jgi:O-antigen/teichoic acid export membrane protein
MAVGEEGVVSQSADEVGVPPDTAPLARQTLAYGLSGLIAPLVGLITLPVFARAFTQSQYGLLELATTTSTVALALTDAGLTAAMLRSFYDYRTEEEPERRSVMRTGLVATTIFALVLAGLMILFRGEIASKILQRSDEESLVVLIAGSVVALNTWRFVSEVMRVRLLAFNYLATTLLAASITTAVGIVGVLALGWRVDGVFLATVIGSGIAAAYGVAVVNKSLAGRFSGSHLRRMLAFGLPLVPATLASWALALVDRIILAHLGSLAQVGEYAIANRLASLLTIGMTAFLFALTPFLFATYSEDPAQEKAARGRTLTYLTFVLALGGLVLTLFAHEILSVIAPRFESAYKAVGPLMLGMLAYGLVTLLATGIALARSTGRGALLTVFAAGINIGLNFALIPPFGVVGAASATAVGYGFLAIGYYLLSQHLYPTPYEPRKALLTIAAACAFGVLGAVPLGPELVAVLVKLGAIAGFVLVIWGTGTMRRAEFAELKRFLFGMIPLQFGRARA